MDIGINLATQLEERRVQAMVDANISTLKELFSDELYYGHTAGYVDTKASMLEKIGSGQYSYAAIKTHINQTTAIGESGLVITGELTIEANSSGEKKVFYTIYLAVWRLEAETWRLLSLQAAFKK
jgi:hypothetical protein